MRNKRWNPALRHTVLSEPGNEAYLASKRADTTLADMSPCPFCLGSRLRLDSYQSHGQHWLVRCLNMQCNAQGPRRYDPDEALSAWNERRPP